MKRKISTKNIIIIILSLVFIALIVLGISLFGGKSQTIQSPGVSEIQENGKVFSIRSNATNYQKELYDELEEAIKSGTEQEIAELVAKNFVADFFTLSNKTVKNDIGGAQFWLSEDRYNLRFKAINTVYYNLELMARDYGLENLPTVKDIKVSNSYEDVTEDGSYYVEMSWSYENGTFDTKDFKNETITRIQVGGVEVPYIIYFY